LTVKLQASNAVPTNRVASRLALDDHSASLSESRVHVPMRPLISTCGLKSLQILGCCNVKFGMAMLHFTIHVIRFLRTLMPKMSFFVCQKMQISPKMLDFAISNMQHFCQECVVSATNIFVRNKQTKHYTN